MIGEVAEELVVVVEFAASVLPVPLIPGAGATQRASSMRRASLGYETGSWVFAGADDFSSPRVSSW